MNFTDGTSVMLGELDNRRVFSRKAQDLDSDDCPVRVGDSFV